ncbi:hypothetical protein BBO99_00008051 [Phytophthora kernoviae]|uniref:Leucine-rich repeat-containing N-terminal plant-type domain-containing protein n=2 Tax=Phytophthora kernoviae TaxID=325452 RepID=A0A3R7J3W1_9STRA|nr:hypothetical protein G195_006262 [Phytophthora kernoviae 00238/432]KAG2516524.1 hypothetical protein JM18_008008 [Phytophthora kernoviae]RLM96858.1 hypothetical protein BBI17_005241 [Phytophthora kernoviae]RLN75810.1 hypothetical protein BBO99_00008051 [Phytophthora kernoviae]
MDSNAYVIYTNCAILTVHATTKSDGTKSMDASGLKIEVIESFPTVDSLSLDDNRLTGISDGEMSAAVTSISLRNNSISSLQTFSLNDAMIYIDLSDNTIPKLSSWEMPANLQSFRCQSCDISVIGGVLFPSSMSLATLDLSGSNVNGFEVSNSSVDLLENVDDLVVTTTGGNCSDSRTKPTIVRSMYLCVLSDELFNQKYFVSGSDSNTDQSYNNPAEDDGGGGGGLSNWMMFATKN